MITIRKNDPRHSLKGVRWRGTNWQVYRMVRGEMQRRKLPPETTGPELMQAYENLGDVPAPVEGSLAEAVVGYLKQITAKPTYKQIVAHLGQWLAVLGRDRAPATITAAEINEVIQTWQVTPVIFEKGQRGRPAPDGLANDTIRKRLTSLQTCLGNVLPAGVVNPVKECDRPKPTPAETRGVLMSDVDRILAAMPGQRDVKKGAPRQLSLAKIRAAVTAYTGLDPAQIKALKRTDLVLTGDNPRMRVGRDKGDGVPIGWVQLTEGGRAALQAFVDADAFGPYSESAVNRAVKKAAAKVGIPLGTFRQKDLRHSFLTELYRTCGDLATVARFALHCEGSKMTARYARAANETVDRGVAVRFHVPPTAPTPAPAKVLRLVAK